MNKEIKVSDHFEIHQDVVQAVTSYCEDLIMQHGTDILSIAVYGSAISSNFVPKISNVNILCIYKHINLDTLKSSLKIVKSGRKKNIVAPLFLTMEYIKSSLDTFPMEFLDIIDNHRVVFGDDLLSDLKVPMENLRLQCEQQIKSQILRLRQAFLENGTRQKVLKSIICETFNNMFPIFKSLLRLKKESIPNTYDEIIAKMNDVYKFDGQIFTDLLNDKKKMDKVVWKEVDRIFEEYIIRLETLADKIDKMKIQDKS